MAKTNAKTANAQAPEPTKAQIAAKAEKKLVRTNTWPYAKVANEVFDTLGSHYASQADAVGAASRINGKIGDSTLRISKREDGSFGLDLMKPPVTMFEPKKKEATVLSDGDIEKSETTGRSLEELSALVYLDTDKGPVPSDETLSKLLEQKLVTKIKDGKWRVTDEGKAVALEAIRIGLKQKGVSAVTGEPKKTAPPVAPPKNDYKNPDLFGGKYRWAAHIVWKGKAEIPPCYRDSPTVRDYVPRMASVKDAGMKLFWDLKRSLIEIK